MGVDRRAIYAHTVIIMENKKFIESSFEGVFYSTPKPFFGYFTTGYFLKTKEGNILIDPPEDILEYVRFIKQEGGLKHMYFTHCHKTLDCKIQKELEREFNLVMERCDTQKWSSLPEMEIIRESKVSKSVKLLKVPGHTWDSMVIIWSSKSEHWFTGDTLYVYDNKLSRDFRYSEDNETLNKVLEELKKYKNYPEIVHGAISNSFKFHTNVYCNVEWSKNLTACKKKE